MPGHELAREVNSRATLLRRSRLCLSTCTLHYCVFFCISVNINAYIYLPHNSTTVCSSDRPSVRLVLLLLPFVQFHELEAC